MRWLKLIRDIRTERGRLMAMLAAVAFALFAVTAMLSAFGIVTREVRINYLSTNPASATIEVDRVTPQMLATAKAFPGVVEAEARSVIEARVKVSGQWMRMLLFVVEDFGTMRLNLFKPLSGQWPPADGTMLIERQAAGVIGTTEGGTVTVKTPQGAAAEIPVSGIVHDTTLAPAWQEQSGYGYLSVATLAKLGQPAELDELRILLAGSPGMAAIDAQAMALAELLRSQGADVHAVKVPPPGKHPHQGQITAGLSMFLSMALLALLLAAVLVASVLAATLARQVREIGVMKTIGARSGQIAGMYVVLLLGLGTVALLISLPLGVAAGGRLAELMADSMNFLVTGYAVPAWVYAVAIACGLLIPLLAALPAVIRASRITVREALASSGAATALGATGFDRLLAALGGSGLPWLLALRNTFRRRGRLILALALLATGGGLFVTALSVRDGWRDLAATALDDRHYDVELVLAEAAPAARIAEILSPFADVRSFELWGYEQTAFATQGQIDLMRTYTDRGHGSFALHGVPPGTTMIDFPMLEGRWLAESDSDAVVLTQQNHRQTAERPKVGEVITLSVGGNPAAFTVVGIMREIGGGGAYIPKRRYDALVAGGDGGSVVRIAFADNASPTLAADIDAALANAGVAVERTAPLDTLYAALVGHVEVPVRMLIAAAVLLGLIGGLGLASMMTINVTERTREFGIMKAVGALPATIVRIVMGEAVAIALLSWVLALIVAAPLILAIGSMAAGMFGTPLPFTMSLWGVAVWLAVIVAVAIAAAAAPALRASRLIVREALAYT